LLTDFKNTLDIAPDIHKNHGMKMEHYLYKCLLKKPYNRTGWGSQKLTFACLLGWMISKRGLQDEYRMSIGWIQLRYSRIRSGWVIEEQWL
jgi:hypothetical protein